MITHMRRWVLGLGSNLGDRRSNLHAAISLLAEHDGVVLEQAAPIYETPPMGPPQPDYLNTAVRIRSSLSPRALLALVLNIERELGRERRERWGARTIDIDLLDWEGPQIDEAGLTVPHPGLRERAFVWFPYRDVSWRQGLETPRQLEELAPPKHRANLLQLGATQFTAGYQHDREHRDAGNTGDECL